MQGARGHKTATGRMTFRSTEPTFDLMSGIEQCISWIEAVREEPLVTSDSFASSLKSGIELCGLLNKIHPCIIRRVNDPANSQWAERENIEMFLSACKELGLHQEQLFTVADLHSHGKDRPVAVTLHWLGNLCRKKYPNSPTFDPNRLSRMKLSRDTIIDTSSSPSYSNAELNRATAGPGGMGKLSRGSIAREQAPGPGAAGQRTAHLAHAGQRESLNREGASPGGGSARAASMVDASPHTAYADDDGAWADDDNYNEAAYGDEADYYDAYGDNTLADDTYGDGTQGDGSVMGQTPNYGGGGDGNYDDEFDDLMDQLDRAEIAANTDTYGGTPEPSRPPSVPARQPPAEATSSHTTSDTHYEPARSSQERNPFLGSEYARRKPSIGAGPGQTAIGSRGAPPQAPPRKQSSTRPGNGGATTTTTSSSRMSSSSGPDGTATHCSSCQTGLVLGRDAYDYKGAAYCRLCLCGNCAQPFGAGEDRFSPHGQKNYCANCTCESCRTPLREYAATATGKVCMACACQQCRAPLSAADIPPLCNQCRCSACKSSLGGKYYLGSDNLRYCEVCIKKQAKQQQQHTLNLAGGAAGGPPGQAGYNQQGGQRGMQPQRTPGGSHSTTTSTTTITPGHKLCQQCRQPIQGQYVDVKGIPFHSQCFVCVDCGKPGAQRLGRDVYCQNCHPDKETCCVCGQGLRGGGLTALGKTYHDKCFTCENCHNPLPSGKFKNFQGRAFCAYCADQLSRQQ